MSQNSINKHLIYDLHLADNIIKKRSKENMVLKSTHYDFNLHGSVLEVKATRVFKNDKNEAIEAIMTFPVPVQASVYKIQYEMDGKVIEGVLTSKEKARKTYETALDNKNTTLLHEELLRGIHMLSIGNIPAGKSVKVKLWFSLLGQYVQDNVEWRIPVTVGQIYGISPFQPSDDFVIDYNNSYQASYNLKKQATIANLNINGLFDKTGNLNLNKPIILTTHKDNLSQSNFVKLFNGQNYETYQIIENANKTNNPLNIAILCDISGSMRSVDDKTSRFDLMKKALLENASLNKNDKIDLFAFNNSIKKINGNSFLDKIQSLPSPSGGTEIGKCIKEAIALGYHDILVITDGESYDINIQEIAQKEVRISSLLVSDDAFEAMMGQLSILTGGHILFANASYVYALGALLKGLRTPFVNEYKNGIFNFNVGNLDITLKPVELVSKLNFAPDALSAIYGNHIMRFFNDSIAQKIAKRNHFVSYNTSIVLVDKDSVVNDTMPVTVKVGLPEPSSFGMLRSFGVASMNMMSVGASNCGASNVDGFEKNIMPKNILSIHDPHEALLKCGPNNNLITSNEAQKLEDILIKNIDWQYINEYIVGNLSHISQDIKEKLSRYLSLTLTKSSILYIKTKPLELYALFLIAQKSNDRNAIRFVKNFNNIC